jgi:nucleotide-binding universal stress UspA family protein
VLDSARARLLEALQGKVPRPVLDRLDVRFGPAPIVLKEAIQESDADLLVLGGKHHSALGRWLAGSTAHHAVRTADLPILITGGSDAAMKRVLVAVDLSAAARPTLDAAERFADLLGAQLRVLHVVEPVPLLADISMRLDEQDLVRHTEDELERTVWPLIGRAEAERLVRYGPAAATIASAAAEWHADLLVVGSHGKGWVDRVLIGSSTERLLNTLPTAMLVVPVVSGAPRAARSRAKATPRAGRQRAGK